MNLKYGLLYSVFTLLLVSCSSDDDYVASFTLSTTDTIELTATSNAQSTLTFTCTDAWEAFCTDSWVSVSPSSGNGGTYTILITAEANDGDARSSTLVLSSISVQVTITIEQAEYDYTEDKSVKTLQSSTIGSGIPIIIMGDGFTSSEISDGSYHTAMSQAMENIFTEEPIKSLRDYFDVYAITAVSTTNKFNGNTVFGCTLEGGNSTGIDGDERTIQQYAYNAVDDIENVLIVIILNCNDYAGTTFFYYSADKNNEIDGVYNLAISFCPIIFGLENEYFREVLTHEAVGHGFAKLDDEYSYEGTISESEIETEQILQTYNWFLNVDFTDDTTAVLWSTFLSDSNYDTEDLGVYEGASTYMYGAYRPSDDSMMNQNQLGFNAPSRQAIYNMVMERATGVTPTYDEFVSFDMEHQPDNIGTRSIKSRNVYSSTANSKRFGHPRFKSYTKQDLE